MKGGPDLYGDMSLQTQWRRRCEDCPALSISMILLMEILDVCECIDRFVLTASTELDSEG
jgi:hypothetical protein